MHTKTLAVLAAIVLFPIGTFAQTFSGSIESGAGWWVQSTDLYAPLQTFNGQLEGKVGNPDTPAAQYRMQLRTTYDPSSRATAVTLRETWMKAYLGPFDLSVGNQIVAWGATDFFTPVDVVNPQDYTLPVNFEKIPVTMGRLVYNGNQFTVDLVAQPFWAGSISPAARWQASSSGGNPTTLNNTPAPSWDNFQYGGRFQMTQDWSQGFDAGVTYFHGVKTSPTGTVAFGSGGPVLTLNYPQYSMAGLDADLALDGGLLLRVEGAYSVLNGTDWITPSAGNASAEGVAAAEYTVLGVKTISEFDSKWSKGSAGFSDAYTYTLFEVLSGDVDSRLSLQGIGALNLDGSGFLSPQATYTLADGLQVKLSFYGFFGASGTTYGAWDNNNLGEVSMKYSF